MGAKDTALMTRIDMINDRVGDVKDDLTRHEGRLVRLEDMAVDAAVGAKDLKEAITSVGADVQKVMDGPVYSIDRFVTKRVAQITGGVGLFGFLLLKSLDFF